MYEQGSPGGVQQLCELQDRNSTTAGVGVFVGHTGPQIYDEKVLVMTFLHAFRSERNIATQPREQLSFNYGALAWARTSRGSWGTYM